MPSTSPASVRTSFREARQTPRARHRDIAQTLGISEGELVAAHAGPFEASESPLKARRLRADWPQIVATLESLGEVMALTRNESCVHEKVGRYGNTSVNGHVGLVLAGAIDLRIFYAQWAHGFAVEELLLDGSLQRSLQFYDAAGQAIHKVFLKPQSQVDAWLALADRFADTAAAAPFDAQAPAVPPGEKPDAQIDAAAFGDAWAGMQDTHEFFGLLKRFGVSRTQGLRLAPPQFVQAMPAAAVNALLTGAARDAVPIMVFVDNPGMIQIHGGPVQRIEVMGPWLNVLDPGFNLHLRQDHITQAWLVRKPTSDGLVHSLELFDAEGETIAMFFGERKPGQPEREDWRTLLATLDTQAEACAA